jgi:hypothetical protein
MEGKVLERAHEREGQEGGAAGRKVRHAPGAVGGFDEEVNELQGMGGGRVGSEDDGVDEWRMDDL